MGAPLNVNWEAVRLLAVQIGVREAARRMGLPEGAVMMRSSREGWLANLPRSAPLPPTMVRTVSGVSNASEAAVNYLKDTLVKTRTNHAKTALIVSADMLALAETEPKAFRDPDMAGVLLTTGKHAALAGSWQTQAPTHKIQLAATGSEGITLEAEIVEEASTDISDY